MRLMKWRCCTHTIKWKDVKRDLLQCQKRPYYSVKRDPTTVMKWQGGVRVLRWAFDSDG